MFIARLRKVSFGAMLAGRCPRCHKGQIFQPIVRAPLAMNPTCPVCGLEFEREPGYFLGAMYFSYTFGVILVVPVALVLAVAFNLSLVAVLLIALVQTLLTMVLAFRYSRILWLYLDQVIDPR